MNGVFSEGLVRIGKYRLLSELGRGGMGVVYLAEDGRLQRQVALKILHPFLSMDEEFVRRFTSEAQAIAALSHGGIVRVHAFEEVAGSHLIDMEYIEGGSLDRRLQEGPLNPTYSMGIALRVLDALAACHERSIIHRDIKPSNILLAADGRVLLSDFGLARSYAVTGAPAATTSSFIGTPKYAAPESWSKGGATPAGDVYSAGLVLLELLAGRTPYDGDSPLEIMRKMIAGSPMSSRRYLPTASDALVALIDAMLSPEPAGRPANAAFALQRLKETPEILSMPEDRSDTVRITPVRMPLPEPAPPRRRGAVAIALLLAVAGLIGWAAYVQRPAETEAPASTEDLTIAPPARPAAAAPSAPPRSPEVNNVFLAGEHVVFTATVGDWRSLWTFDPATGEAVPLWPALSLAPEDDIHGIQPVNRGVVGVIRSPINGFTLFRTDGTREGTVSLAHAASWEASRIVLFTAYEGTAYFCRAGGDNTSGVWKTDGTLEGTQSVFSRLNEIFIGMDVTPTGGLFAFGGASDRVHYFAPGETTPVILGQQQDYTVFANRMITLGERAILEANGNDGAGRELWVGGTTSEDVQLLRDFMPGDPSGMLDVDFGRFQDKVVFTPSTPEYGREPWLTDGTKEGTHLLCDINPGTASSTPLRFIESGSLLFFSAEDARHGKELWVSDGTPSGTRLAKNIAEGWRSSNPHSLKPFKGGVLFTADDLDHGEELWFSDGTEAGTRLIRDCMPGPEGRGAFGVEVAGDRAFFAATHPEHGRVLWESDGTEQGTRPLFEQLRPALPARSEPAAWTNLTNKIIVTIATPEYGAEPWIVDETRADAQLIRDIRPGPESSQPSDYLEFNGKAYFVADDGILGRELWCYGGAPELTSIVHDAWKGKGSGNPRHLTLWPPNRVAYVAFNGTEDEIYYVSDERRYELRIAKPRTILSPWAPRDLRPGLDQWLYFSNQTASGETTFWRSDGDEVRRVAGLGRTATPE